MKTFLAKKKTKNVKKQTNRSLNNFVRANQRILLISGVLVLVSASGASAFWRNNQASRQATDNGSPMTANQQSQATGNQTPLNTTEHSTSSSSQASNKPNTATPSTPSDYPYNNYQKKPFSASLDRTAVKFRGEDIEYEGSLKTILVILDASNPIDIVSFSGYDTSKISFEVGGNTGYNSRSIYVKYLGNSVEAAGSTTATITVKESYDYKPLVETVTLKLNISWEPKTNNSPQIQL